MVRLVPVRSPLLRESRLISFPLLTKMFQFSRFRVSFRILFGKEQYYINSIRLPHSDISGSELISSSPKLFAAYHVLHRLIAPRHPLCALSSLIPFQIHLDSAHNRRNRKLLLRFRVYVDMYLIKTYISGSYFLITKICLV